MPPVAPIMAFATASKDKVPLGGHIPVGWIVITKPHNLALIT